VTCPADIPRDDHTEVSVRTLIERLTLSDQLVIEALSRRGVPSWVDRGLRIVTHLGGAIFTVILCILLLAIPFTRQLGLATSLSNLISHLVAQVVKRTVGRRRPTVLQSHIIPLSMLPDPYSFPSGHSCASMSIAVSVLLVVPAAGVPAIMMASVVGASRVYLRIHYPTDAVVGQLIGAGSAVAVWAMLA
jgi:undecaprenyl-diphosphatase